MMSMCEWCDYKEYEWLLHKSLHGDADKILDQIRLQEVPHVHL